MPVQFLYAKSLKQQIVLPLVFVIWPGSPGHCCIIIDETTDGNGEKLYKLAEGYMPAQSIYVLSNLYEPELSPWYHLNKNEVLTASCDFKSFQLKKFE